jgi:hypothetical protein
MRPASFGVDASDIGTSNFGNRFRKARTRGLIPALPIWRPYPERATMAREHESLGIFRIRTRSPPMPVRMARTRRPRVSARSLPACGRGLIERLGLTFCDPSDIAVCPSSVGGSSGGVSKLDIADPKRADSSAIAMPLVLISRLSRAAGRN